MRMVSAEVHLSESAVQASLTRHTAEPQLQGYSALKPEPSSTVHVDGGTSFLSTGAF